MNKKLSALTSAAILAAGSMVAGVPGDEPRKPVKAAKPKSFPDRAALRKMSKEKRDYWVNRMTGNSGIKPRVAQYLAGRTDAADPELMTRQVRRQNERHGARVMLASAKERAARNKTPGGAAAVRSI